MLKNRLLKRKTGKNLAVVMSRIVLAPFGSLGDLHPFLAIGIELRNRGHEIVVSTLEPYREKIDALGFEFRSLRPHFDPEDREKVKEVMDERNGSETLIRKYILPSVKDMYHDLEQAIVGAEMLVAGEVAYASHLIAEKHDIKFVTTTLAPLSMFSAYEPTIYPNAQFLRFLNPLGRPFQAAVLGIVKWTTSTWLEDYRAFRIELGLEPDHDPIVTGKYSRDLHLAMFSKVLGQTQPDWNSNTLQTGFCFYDGSADLGKMPAGLEAFLDAGKPPIVFTLGSAAVMDAGRFFEESIAAAKLLDRRAVILYGVFNHPPEGLDLDRAGFDYAPFSQLFPRAACVVHQGGAGTVAQVLKAGVPHLIVPFSHDQPDNAARCKRLGVARIISRNSYRAKHVASELKKLLTDKVCKAKALEQKRIIEEENGTAIACDALEIVLKT